MRLWIWWQQPSAAAGCRSAPDGVRLHSSLSDPPVWARPSLSLIHIFRVDNDARTDYVEYLASTAPARAEGIRVLVDCANGAASTTARELFTAIGADFTIINDTPDGININVDCGSTHIEQLCPRVVGGGYDLGIALDVYKRQVYHRWSALQG